MTRSTGMRKSEVGELRPSQVLHTFGVGSIVDLPNMSVMVMGLEDWPIAHSTEIGEERLLLSVRNVLGPQVSRLLTPPRTEEAEGWQSNWFDDSHTIGVPVAPFPRWIVCSYCRLLAPISSGLFEPKVVPYRPDRACYVHSTCTKKGQPPVALAGRFLVACERGHLDDFPWLDYAHRGKEGCPGPLRLHEIGASGEAADVEVACDACGARRRMAEAFGRDNLVNMPECRGRRPQLRDVDGNGCDVPHLSPILQGASNSWFPVMLSVLSVPPQSANKLSQLVEENWTVLEKALSKEVLQAFRQIGQLKDFVNYDDDAIWEAIEKKRQGPKEAAADTVDLKTPEWEVLSNPARAKETRNFKLRAVEPPDGYTQYFEQIALVERLREVRSLIGFTRISSARDFDSSFELPTERRAPLSRRSPTWVPATETRGEGIFFQFSETVMHAWLDQVRPYEEEFFKAHQLWRAARNLDAALGFPGMRLILLHSFAHALIRQLAVECGYNTASISERLYSRSNLDGDPMAGVLIYTSAPDSEGTLGGLCALGRPHRLGWHLDRALESMRLCASDPLCSEHVAGRDGTLHGASCHACSFLPETSCERGNKYLDRSVLVPTIERSDLAFFELPGDPRRRVAGPVEKKSSKKKRGAKAKSGSPAESEVTDHALVDLVAHCDDRCRDFLRHWAEEQRLLPEVGYELQDSQGRVLAQAELAWPDRQVAIVMPEEHANVAAFEQEGWTVLGLQDLAKPHAELSQLPRG